VKGVIWCAGAGQTGFEALGEVLNGTVNPSGKTVDTYLYDLLSSPVANNIGDFAYDNTYDLVNPAGGTDNYAAHFVNYVEGIYVGYKFYETAAAEGLIDYDATVQYPFGYGLSYTTFEQKLDSVTERDGTVTVKATVTNTGSVAGKDVVEVYYNPPYTNGGIEKASVNLIEFAKTQILQPGDSEQVEVSFTLEDMASYDDKVNGCYVLEAGDYEISIRTDSHHVIDTQVLSVASGIIYDDNNPRSTDAVAATNRFDYAAGDIEYLSRADGFANYETATAAPKSYSMSDEVMQKLVVNATYNVNEDINADAVMPTTGAKNGLTLEDMVGVDYDDEKWDRLLDQLSISEMSTLVSMGGYMTSAVESIGLATTIETDGPSGLHSNFTELEGTAFPSAVMIASTWNQELAEQRGELVGRQGQELGISGWYGPAINIHRSAFSGRNFEYYSEDAVLSGILAAKETAGARKYGMQTYLKHFAINDQEANRIGMLLVWSNEQAIRESYLKAFEIAFKKGGSNSCMSSYNFIGYKWAGANDELLNGVLRGEWGFDGVVVTDWYGGYGYMNADLAIRNGGDRMLTTTDMAKLADTQSATSQSAIREASHNILYSLANSNIMSLDVGMASWMQLLYIVNGVTAAVVILLEVLFIIKLRKKKQPTTVE
jgi:beta-glucosidase